MLVTSVRRFAMLLAPLLLLAAGLLVWLAHPAHAASKDVTIVSGGSYPLSCENASYGYAPVNVAVQPGDTVTFANPGSASGSHPCAPADHPTACIPESTRGKTVGDCPFSNFALPTGGSHTQPFPEEGTFQLRCSAHPYMLMTVVVGDGEPDPDPTESQPEPTEPEPEPTQPAPQPTEAEPDDTPAPAATTTGTASPAPEQPTETEPTVAPTETATNPTADVEIGAGGSSATRGLLLVVGTALLGFNIAMLVGARNPATRSSWLR